MKNLCASKDSTKKGKRQSTEEGRIFANQISRKGQLNGKETKKKNPNGKTGNRFE